jgi:hypothetical protein
VKRKFKHRWSAFLHTKRTITFTPAHKALKQRPRHIILRHDGLGERQQCAGINYANQIQTLSSLPDNTSSKIMPQYETRRFHELSNAHLVFNLTSKFYWKISASFYFCHWMEFFTNREVMTSTYPYKQFVFFLSVSC